MDSEVEDRVDGVKSWLSKNKGPSKAPSDDGSLKSSSPTSHWKSLGPDPSDDEHDPADSISRPRFSHNYLSDSDTEAKLTETDA